MTEPRWDGPLEAAARLLARRVGLRFDPSIRGRLARCVLDEAKLLQLDTDGYVRRLEQDPGLLQDLLNRVTVQETAFFRDPNQFDTFASLAAGLRSPVTVWSAACANGQEAYSLAMILAEVRPKLDWRVVASDVSTRALERTRRAVYSSREMVGVTPERRSRHFVHRDHEWEVVDSLRQRVDVVHQNLVLDDPPITRGPCEVVFCRNVLIYLEPEEVAAFIERLASWLAPDAWLFLGYSESLWQVTDRFRLVRHGDAFVYRRGEVRLPDVGRRSPSPPVQGRSRPNVVRPAGEASRIARSIQTRQPRPSRHRSGGDVAPLGEPRSPSEFVELLASGEAAVNAGDFAGAVAAFRKCVYLDPDQPIAHLHLGLALEASGADLAARRAYSAARSALQRGGTAAVEAVLEGYHIDELEQLVAAKLGLPPRKVTRDG